MMNFVLEDIAARAEAGRRWIATLSPQLRLAESEELIAAVKATANSLLEALDGAANARTQMASVVALERFASLFDGLRAQRRTIDSDVLFIADAAARDGYQRLLRAAFSLGADSTRLARYPVPVVAVEPMVTPVTYVRHRSVRAPGFMDGKPEFVLPFPLVLIPPYADVSISGLTVVLHEVGHDFDEDFGITEHLRAPLADAMRRAGASDEHVSAWGEWLRELVADTIGSMLAGSPFAAEMRDWSELLPQTTRGSHPPTTLRVRWAEAYLSALGVSVTPLPLGNAPDATLVNELHAALKAVLSLPIPTLNGHTLGDIAPIAPAQELALAAATNLDADILSNLRLHLVPSVARLARAAGVANADKRLRAHFVTRALETSAAFRFASFRTKVLASIEAPILADEEDGLKRPPAELFERATGVAFVGGSNDGLPKLFTEFRQRGLSPKHSIEIFFLDEVTIRKLEHPGRSASAYVSDRAQALTALDDGLLNAIAESWCIREHDEPFVFASYWDAWNPGGRIHASAHAWGQDVTRAPAFDYQWEKAQPVASRAYRFYLDGLDGLRTRARTIRASAARARL